MVEIQNDKDNGQLLQAESLSHTDMQLIHIARALVASPSLLVMQRPFKSLDSHAQRAVKEALRTFVVERGLLLNAEKKGQHNLRTLLFSCADLDQVLAKELSCRTQRRR